MNKEQFEKNVRDYIESNNHSPLKFGDYESPVGEFDPTKYSIASMVLRCLEISKWEPSIDSVTGEYETSSGRSRSSIDIWRHIIYYYPEVTIFQVIGALWDTRGKTSSGFCSDVQRRVFYAGTYIGSDNFCSDEYCVQFPEWSMFSLEASNG